MIETLLTEFWKEMQDGMVNELVLLLHNTYHGRPKSMMTT